MSPEVVGLIGIALLLLLLSMRMYIGLALIFVGFLGYSYLTRISIGLELFGTVPYTTGSMYELSIIPLFILMGQFAHVSGLSRDIFNSVYKWIGHFPGGLAMATVFGCGGFAAISGSSTATAATMGSIALPEMKEYKYDARLATGCVAAGGTIGILIPPSIGFVVYGILTEESIGKLFMAGIIPGVMLLFLYMAVIYIMCRINPELGPKGEKPPFIERIKALRNTWETLLLFLVVMGGIYFGIFTPIEAAGIGAFGTFLFALLKRKMNVRILFECLLATGRLSGMIMLIMIGADIYAYFLSISKIPMSLAGLMTYFVVSKYLVLAAILLIYFILGCFLDAIAMIVLTIPIFYPLTQSLGLDPIWLGVIIVIIMEIGLITPPVGMNVFVIRGIAKDVPITTIFKGIWPFLVASILAIIIIILIPPLATFIPSRM
jgi:C4-dicarboxylate transporter DctM subunit